MRDKVFGWIAKYYSKGLSNMVKAELSEVRVRKILEKKTEFRYHDSIILTDKKYKTSSYGVLKDLIKFSPIKFKVYQAEVFDCDDFAISFAGLYKFLLPNFLIGLVWVKKGSTKHLMNFFVDKNGSVAYIEPQTNQVYFSPDWIPYRWIV